MSTSCRKRNDVDSDNESPKPPKKRQKTDTKQILKRDPKPKLTKEKKKKKQFKYHPGELEADSDAWPDHEEETHGPFDTNANRREWPGCFFWDCCNKQGNDSGCELRSRPATPISEKYATSEPSLDDEEYYHPGELEVDSDEWPDHEEETHGPIDTGTNRAEYPNGFVWSCCGKYGTFTQGCCKRDDDEY
eukprot:236392_1